MLTCWSHFSQVRCTATVASNSRPTCDQVLVLVDVELDAAQALGGVCVDVLHVLDFVESFVHLKDTRNNIRYAYLIVKNK